MGENDSAGRAPGGDDEAATGGPQEAGAAYTDIDGVLHDPADVVAPEPPDAGEGSGIDLAREALAAARRGAAARPQRSRRRRGGGRGLRRARGYSGSGADGRDPERFGATIDRFLDERGWRPAVADASVMGRWEEIVGAEIADHARPESLVDGELTLVAESTAWATQLRLLAPTILARIADDLGAGVVRTMRVHGPTAPDWRRGPRRVQGRGPRDTYG